MISNDVLLRFLNKFEYFDPLFVFATSNAIGFHALKKHCKLILNIFSNLECTVSISESCDQNCYYYVIQ